MAQTTHRVTAVLLSCDCASFVVEALRSVLVQEGEAMQVIVSDDASTDGTFEILERELQDYDGLHRVELRRRTSNSGSKSAHLNDVLPLARGEVIVSFDDDDVSVPHRVRRIMEAFDENPELQAVYSGYSLMDENGRNLRRGDVPHPGPEDPAPHWFARVDAYAAGTTLAIRRSVFEVFGPLDPDVHEDIALPFRASLLGDVRYLDEDLVGVRRRRDSLTARPDRFDSMESYRRGMERGVQQAHKNLRSRLADLETARANMPDRAPELAELAERARETAADADVTLGLVSPSVWKRLSSLWWLFRKGVYREELVQNLALVLLPRAYLRFKRGKLRSQAHQGRRPSSHRRPGESGS